MGYSSERHLFLLNIITIKRVTVAINNKNYEYYQKRGMPNTPPKSITTMYEEILHKKIKQTTNMQNNLLNLARDHVVHWHKNSLSVLTSPHPTLGKLPLATRVGPKTDAITYDFGNENHERVQKEIDLAQQAQRGVLSLKKQALINDINTDIINGNIQFPAASPIISLPEIDRAIEKYPPLDGFFMKFLNNRMLETNNVRNDAAVSFQQFLKAAAADDRDATLKSADAFEYKLQKVLTQAKQSYQPQYVIQHYHNLLVEFKKIIKDDLKK